MINIILVMGSDGFEISKIKERIFAAMLSKLNEDKNDLISLNTSLSDDGGCDGWDDDDGDCDVLAWAQVRDKEGPDFF